MRCLRSFSWRALLSFFLLILCRPHICLKLCWGYCDYEHAPWVGRLQIQSSPSGAGICWMLTWIPLIKSAYIFSRIKQIWRCMLLFMEILLTQSLCVCLANCGLDTFCKVVVDWPPKTWLPMRNNAVAPPCRFVIALQTEHTHSIQHHVYTVVRTNELDWSA